MAPPSPPCSSETVSIETTNRPVATGVWPMNIACSPCVCWTMLESARNVVLYVGFVTSWIALRACDKAGEG